MGDKEILEETITLFIIANQIVAQRGIVDGFGHVSVRNPYNPHRFITSLGVPPALVTSLDSIGHYTVEGAIPIINGAPDPSSRQSPWSERFIHASLFARFPSVNAVIHSHSPSVVAFSVSDVPLKPVWHMAGFLEADGAKVWDIDHVYRELAGEEKEGNEKRQSQKHNLLVNDRRLGDSLAAAFSAPPAHHLDVAEEAAATPAAAGVGDAGDGNDDHRLRRQVVLQRGHGFAVVGASLQEVVYRAIYTQENARIQRDALAAGADSVRYLTDEEARDCRELADSSVYKAWPLWVKEASMGALFRDRLRE